MKIIGIDPFSIREERSKAQSPKERPQVAPPQGAELDSVTHERGEKKILDIIEEAKRRLKKKQSIANRRRQFALMTYTKVGFDMRSLHERGKKLDTKG